MQSDPPHNADWSAEDLEGNILETVLPCFHVCRSLCPLLKCESDLDLLVNLFIHTLGLSFSFCDVLHAFSANAYLLPSLFFWWPLDVELGVELGAQLSHTGSTLLDFADLLFLLASLEAKAAARDGWAITMNHLEGASPSSPTAGGAEVELDGFQFLGPLPTLVYVMG
jgi:hypothetical protein